MVAGQVVCFMYFSTSGTFRSFGTFAVLVAQFDCLLADITISGDHRGGNVAATKSPLVTESLDITSKNTRLN